MLIVKKNSQELRPVQSRDHTNVDGYIKTPIIGRRGIKE